MVLLEEFKDKVRPDIRSHLDEQKVEELEKAAVMADDYALTHKMSSKSGNPQQKRYHGSGNRENISRNADDRKRQGKSTENVGLVSKVEPLKPISCGHCGKPGHIITNCWKLGGKTPCEHCGRFNHKSEDCRIAKNKLQKEVKPTGLTSLKGLKVSPFNESENSKGVKVKPLIDRNHFVEKNKGIKVNPLHNDKSCIEDKISPETESDYMENYKPFISEGVVSLVGDENSSQKVKILRDTGATQSLMLDSVLPLTENSFTGANVLISGVEMGVLEVPLHAHFEKVADSLNWPKESWVLLLQSVLVGKAQEIYGSLSVEQSSKYEHVKEAILKAYELVPEAYRQKFRNYLKYDSKTHVEFVREKENLFNRWCHSKEIGQDFKKLKQMVLLEEFKDKVRPDIRSHLDEQKVEELEKAAVMADDYALTHKMSSKSGNPQQKRYHGSGNRENISRNADDRKRQGKSTENVGLVSKVEPLKPISCGHCGKPGHIITNCWKLGGKTPCEHCGRFNHKSEDCRIAKNKLQKEVKPTGLTSLKGLKVSPFNESENSKGVKVKPLIDRNHFVEKNKGIKVNPLHNDKSCIEDKISPETESDYMENYKPFISEGVVSLVGDENSSQKVKILRDTGATQSLMLDSVLPLTENSFTGANVLISGVEMGVLEVPLHAHFEKVADSLNWPKESWVLLLQSVLVGKAQEIYGSLSVEQSSKYEHVKEAILKAYELVPEAYRQKFRNYLKYDSKTHVEFVREKENLFNRWCHSKEIGQDFKKLKQMVLLEEFKDKVRPDIRSHLDEQKVEELEKAAVMADDYALTHKMSSKSGNPQQKRYHGSGNRENISRNVDDRKRQGKSTENVGLVSKVEPLKPISCGHCGKPGHIITNCWKLGGKTPCEHCGRFNHKSEDCRIAKNKLQKEVKPTGLTSLKGLKVSPFNESENSKGVKVKPLIDRNHFVEKNKGIKVNPLHNDKSCIEDKISPETESDYMENYKPFISEGVVSLVGDENSSQKVKILRDTGATQSLMLDSVLPLTENSFTGANVLISGVEMGVLEVPLHEVNIKSSLINGNIVIGMRPSLPVEGISLILGNDLAGERVMVDPRVVKKPRDYEKTERLAEKFPGIFSASVVTRSMKAKKEVIKEQGKEEIGLSGTFLENIDVKFEERNKEKSYKALMRNESRNNIPEKQESESKSVISRQNLIEEQNNDKELLDLVKIALTPVEAEKVSVGYLIRDNILMRKWSSHCVTIGPLLLLREK